MQEYSKMTTDKIFLSYMHLISSKEGEEIYRLNEPAGEGIMRHTHIANGVELVYSELEEQNPTLQEEQKAFDMLEIMYIVDGHAEFELANRQFVSGEKGDVMIFNSQSAVRRTVLGKSGMNCISLILFTEDAILFLNDFLQTKTFSKEIFFPSIRSSKGVMTICGSELLEKLFLETIKLPSVYSKFKTKLCITQIILNLMEICKKNESLKNGQNDLEGKELKESSDLYFSGTTGRKVQNVRRLINANLENEISIEELSQKVNLNRTTMQKVFKEMYGLTVNEYKTKARIQKAKNLLATTDFSITKISSLCGYVNASKFSEVFKKQEGILPKDFRKEI